MPFVNKKILIPIGRARFEGTLTIPPRAKVLIVFAHGGGGGRTAPRNNYIARFLNKNNIGTLLFDLLSKEEDRSNKINLNPMLLSRRLTSATLWLLKQQETKSLRLAYFSVSSGAAAAIISASKMPEKIFAIVSKSGRPDLSKRHINLLRTPILFITGGDDEIITEINEKAYIQVPSEKEMVIIPDADYLFDEPNASMEVAKLSLKWFKKQLREKS